MMEHGQLTKAMSFIRIAIMKVTKRGRKLTHNYEIGEVAEPELK